MSLFGIQLFPSRNSSPPDPPDDREQMDVLESFRRGFGWIKDENLLRDEGVIAGIAQARPESKIRLIQNYIEFEKASREVEIEELEKLLEEKKQELGEVRHLVDENGGEETITRAENDKVIAEPELHLISALTNLTIITLTLVSCFHLLRWWLNDVTRLPGLVATGVLFFGAFSIFLPRPYLFDLEGFYEAMPLFKRWRVYFETFVPPLAATVFAITWGQTDRVSGWQIGALAVFLFVLFLITGRLFLRYLKFAGSEIRKAQAKARTRIRTWQQRRRTRKYGKQRRKSAEAIEAEIKVIRDRLLKVKQDWESLDRLAPTLVDYFQTEYDIASSYTRNQPPNGDFNGLNS